MKLSLNWLKDYIDPKLSTEDLVERLAMSGLEVEGIEYVGQDIVLDIEVTPNRPDCLSTLGLAREIGAITGKLVKYPKIKNFKASPSPGLVHIENKKDCCRYIATLIREVCVNDAPKDMQQRLMSMGMQAINNVVDVTNFVMMETGQPLHAFDYDTLAGGKVIVRRARSGETIVTLDGIERKLDPRILVIADAKKPVAIAGVMGGMDTQITEKTKNILLESAHFEMGLIRMASRSLGLRSDSSYRFERNVNVEGVLKGADRATDLLLQLTAGDLSGRAQMEVKVTKTLPKIKIKSSAIEALLGVQVTPQKVKTWLERLGFKVTAKAGVVTVIVPTPRCDIQQEVDVIEEIARMIGFDHLPSRLPVIKTSNMPVNKRPREIKDRIRRVLSAGGVDEIVTLSMINTKALVRSHLTQMPSVRIFNPLSQDQELMRPVLLPSFLQAAVTNFNRGQKDLRFFEMGKTYSLPAQGKLQEKETLGILLTGRRLQEWRSSKKEGVDVFDLKGIIERIFQGIGLSVVYETTRIQAFDPDCAVTVVVGGKEAGIFGKIDRKVLNNWDIKNQDVFFAVLHLDEILAQTPRTVKYQPVSGFPAVTRDVSLAVKKEVPYKDIEAICIQQGGEILRRVQFIEQYLGDKIQPGCKGLVFSCHYQSDIRTLREDEVSAVHERILQVLTHDLGAIRR